MSDKEATARIKINKLLEAGGWRFFADGDIAANIRLEPSVTIDLDALGDNFEKTAKGYIDFLLLDAKGFPFIVLEADGDFFISDWLRNRNTVEFLGIWERVHNPDFNYGRIRHN